MNNDARPYERFVQRGAGSLTDDELLAILIRSGTEGQDAVTIAEQILRIHEDQYESDCRLNGMLDLTMEELLGVKGIGTVKAVRILCIAEFMKRLARQRLGRHPVFTSPDRIAQYYMEDMRRLDREQVMLVLLDGHSQLIHDEILSIGTVNTSPVSAREILQSALRYRAVYIVLLHNHPSGDSTPSKQDIVITERVRAACELMNIPLLDHIIIGDHEFTSMKDKAFM